MGNEDFTIIGKAIYNTNPQLAQAILRLSSPLPTRYSDFGKIPKLFDLYCIENKVMPDLNSRKKNKDHTEHCRIFMAAVILLYQPSMIYGLAQPQMKRGLRKALSKAANLNLAWITNNVAIIKTRLDVYDDFKFNVSSTRAFLTEHYHSC